MPLKGYHYGLHYDSSPSILNHNIDGTNIPYEDETKQFCMAIGFVQNIIFSSDLP
jgi:hypothetical protein